MSFFIPAKGPDDWQMFLAEPEKQWRTGYSAKSLAYCWHDARDGFPPSVRAVLDGSPYSALHGLTRLLAIPEHRVPLPGGRRASQTDLFVLAKSGDDLVSMTVEGKVAEPFGPLVSEWLAPRAAVSGGDLVPASEGKRERIAYLCDALGVSIEQSGGLRYQLFHRTVSALIEARRFNARHALMLVHTFSKTSDWFSDYGDFARALGVANVAPNSVAHVGTREGVELYVGWATGEAKWLEV